MPVEPHKKSVMKYKKKITLQKRICSDYKLCLTKHCVRRWREPLTVETFKSMIPSITVIIENDFEISEGGLI